MYHIAFDAYTLDNGLRVVHHHAPEVAKIVVNILYRVGAKHEDPNRTGFAHLFEHLMFEGSRHIQHYDKWVEQAGGESNAYTTNDLTNYHIQLPANQLETALWLESDRMLELDFNQGKLDVQKSVVCEEFKQRYLNQPYGDAYLHLRPLMYKQHPYQWMTIGKNLAHIEDASLQDVKSFFFNHYAPNNATLVLAGGLTADETRPLVEKWFGGLPARKLGIAPLPPEPPQTEARVQTVSAANIPTAQVYKAWHTPARAADDYMPTELWAEVLAGGKNARLYQHLVVKTKVAASVGAFSWGLHDTGKFSINAQLAEGRTVEEYEQALAEVMGALDDSQTGIAEPELESQRTKNIAEDTFEKATLMSRAQALAQFDCLGDIHAVNMKQARIRQVNIEGMEAFRKKYLRPENCSTLYYLPA